jgi:O-antigen/teichoic acid export membrane protein
MAEASFRLLGNSAWNAAAFLTGTILNLLVLPFVVVRLGVAAFGVAGLVAACVAPALVFSNALGLSASREFAQRLSEDQRDEARRFFSSALLLAIAAGGAITLLLALAGAPLAHLAFNLAAGTIDDLGLAFLLAAAGWFCQCLSAVFLSLFIARQDYAQISLISILNTIVTTASILVLVPHRPLASTYLGCQALGFLTTLIAAVVLSRKRFAGWLGAPALHRSSTGQLARFGVWQLLAQGGGLVAAHADRYLIGALLAPQFVGFYVIAQRLEEAIYIGILKVGEILFPFFSALQKADAERMTDLFFRSSWVLNILAVSALGGVIPVAGPLLSFWTGAEVAEQAQYLLVVLSIAGILGCSANVFAFYLLASGRSRANALIAAATAAVTLATSILTLPTFGWVAAGFSACAGMSAQLITVVALMRGTFGGIQIWRRIAHFAVVPLLTGIAVALLLRHLVTEMAVCSDPHWWCVGALYGLAAAIILTAVVAVSQAGPFSATCRRDLRSIVLRFAFARADKHVRNCRHS